MKQLFPKAFTTRQLNNLKSIKPGRAVNDLRLLKKLSKLGVATLHEHTGRIVSNAFGIMVRAFYLDDAEMFEVQGVGIFRRQFVSGCFSPYLVRAELRDRGRVKY